MYSKLYHFLFAVLLTATPVFAESEAAEPQAVGAEPTAPAPLERVEVAEDELVEIVGYLTAQSGGVPSLQLEEGAVASLADGLEKCLSGELDIMQFAQETVEAAFGEAQARAEAIEASAEEIPAITAASLEKIGAVIVMQSGLQQLGFGADAAALIRKGFVAGALDAEPDPSLEAKMPAFQEFIQVRVQVAQAKMQAEMMAAKEAAMADFADV